MLDCFLQTLLSWENNWWSPFIHSPKARGCRRTSGLTWLLSKVRSAPAEVCSPPGLASREVSAAFPSLLFPQAWVAALSGGNLSESFGTSWGWGCALMPNTWWCLSRWTSTCCSRGGWTQRAWCSCTLGSFLPLVTFHLCVIKGQTFSKEELSICCDAPVPPFLRARVKLWGTHYFLLRLNSSLFFPSYARGLQEADRVFAGSLWARLAWERWHK